MTLPATTRRAGPFNGNGTATTFPFGFKVFDGSDLLVLRTDANGTEVTLAEGADYSVALNADQETSPGGSVTYPLSGSPLATGQILAVVGNLPYDQTTDLPAGGAYRAQTHEDTFDRIVMQIQQLAEAVGRALVAPPSAGGSNYELPAPSSNKYIGWNLAGTALENKSASGGGGGGGVDTAADYDWTGQHSFVTGGEPGILVSGITNMRIGHTTAAGGVGGGTDVRSPFVIDHKVVDGTLNYEWSVGVRNSNYASGGGDQVAGYFQAYKYANAGRSWALVGEAKDMSGNSGAGILNALELNLFANGSAGAASRVGIHATFGKAQAGLAQSVARAGIELIPNGSDKTQAKLTNGIDIQINCDNAMIRQANTATAEYAIDFLNGGGVNYLMNIYTGAFPAFELGGSEGTYVGKVKFKLDGFVYWWKVYG